MNMSMKHETWKHGNMIMKHAWAYGTWYRTSGDEGNGNMEAMEHET
jgi:hypothetical protein